MCSSRLSTPMTQAAINATSDMDIPPAIIFAAVFNAAAAGIAESACEKPAHVAGAEASTPYEEVLPLLLVQDPDLQTIGTIFNPAEASSVAGAEAIVAAGENLGLNVEQTSVTGMADLRAATQSLANKGRGHHLAAGRSDDAGRFACHLGGRQRIWHPHLPCQYAGAELWAPRSPPATSCLHEQGIRAGPHSRRSFEQRHRYRQHSHLFRSQYGRRRQPGFRCGTRGRNLCGIGGFGWENHRRRRATHVPSRSCRSPRVDRAVCGRYAAAETICRKRLSTRRRLA